MKTILAILSFVIVFTSCDTPRYAHSPTAHNVPILTKKGDSKVAGYYSNNGLSATTDGANGYDKNISHGTDLQGAVAVTNHIGLQANYFYRSEKLNSNFGDFNFDSSRIRYKRNMFEIGAGYFTQLDTKQRVLLQIFAGAGLGKTTITETGTNFNQLPYSRFYNTDLTKFYLEPSITFRAKEIFAASVATRVSIVKFRNILSNYSFDEKLNFNLDSLDRYPVAFFEPAFVGSFGFNKLPGFRIEIQAGLSLLLDGGDFLYYRPFNFSAGLIFDIRKLIKGANN
ncbi:MAG: hypothetical protein H7258_05315 [Ferruginibacter sp.]|nr:hypothetical protein [Ferruginibacter sp.]